MTSGEHEAAPGTLSALRQSYGAKARYDLNDSVVSRYVYRPLSFYLAVPFVKMGLTPNQVSFVGLAVSMMGMIGIATGRPAAVLIGCILCALQVIIDYVDGNIARLRGISSHLGKFVDGVVDTFIGVVLPVAVGVGLWRSPDAVLQRLFGSDASIAGLTLGMTTGLSTALRNVLVFRLRAAQLDAGASAGPRTTGLHGSGQRSAPERMALRVDAMLRNEMFAMLTLIVVFASIRALGAYIVIRCASSGLALVLEVVRTTVLARRSLDVSRSM